MSLDTPLATPFDHFSFGHMPMHVAADTWMHSEAAEAASAVARQFAANATTIDALVERLSHEYRADELARLTQGA